MASTATKRIWYSNYACQKSGPFPLEDVLGFRQRVCPPTVEAWEAFETALLETGYEAESVGIYNCRPITGGKNLSLHAYGIAVDIDPFALGNPYYGKTSPKGWKFSWKETKFTPEQVAAVEGIKLNNGKRVWFWGGRWNSVKDYMHWEINVPPHNLTESGIDWSTVPGGDDLAFLTEEQQKDLARMLDNLERMDSNVDFVNQAVQDIRQKNIADTEHGGYALRSEIEEADGLTQKEADERYVRKEIQQKVRFE